MTDDERQALAAFDDLDRALERRDRAAVEALWVADDDLRFWGSAALEAAVGSDGLRELLDLIDTVPGSFTQAHPPRLRADRPRPRLRGRR